ncbi:hypothetical protein B0T22DRAFT_477811 [Podospora appendiculata]|uniref:DUF8004 domain-containing protein n=1 Tax=Podospora appendiculata TaxID=314037 RepID=A0AAE0XKL5_9PEZI|nr:hypothetical protein B0T22DRAFT_477811 [Podospora appendiculata]
MGVEAVRSETALRLGGAEASETTSSASPGETLPDAAGTKTIKHERRKSRLGLLFTSLLPMLTSSATDQYQYPPPPLPQPQPPPPPSRTAPAPAPPVLAAAAAAALPLHRKPVPNPINPYMVSPYDYNDSPIGSVGLGIDSTTPPMPTEQPPPPPPKSTSSGPHMPAMLKKAQKAPVVSQSPPVPRKEGYTATQISPPGERKPRDRARSAVEGRTPPGAAKLHSNRLQPRTESPTRAPRGRSTSARPALPRAAPGEVPRIVSSPAVSRSQSNCSSDDDRSHSRGSEKEKPKRRWLRGSRSGSQDLGVAQGFAAWIMSPDSKADYNTAALMNGEKVPELWNEAGNVYVYLHPKVSGHGPSFKVSDHVFSTSRVLNELLLSDLNLISARSGNLLTVDAAQWRPPQPPQASYAGGNEAHLYLPIGDPDLDRLVAVRNLFAFLTKQPLVGTKGSPTLFSALLQIAAWLREFAFSSPDGSSFGNPVDEAFDMFLDQFPLGDVRHSREKTLEALVLAEQMRSWNLYNEAFTHAVGKYESLLDLKSPLLKRISLDTRNRLERAHLDLANRQANISNRLEAFEFPSLFAGIASSTSRDEYRQVRYKEWSKSFAKMRSFVLSYYKDLFGNWPPKARSKKNHFSQSGLNRQCLKILYSDLCALYDLLVDRESMTPRAIDQVEDVEENPTDPMIAALRQMLSEFDHSSPPVLPPIPYDIPKIPTMTTIHENYNELPSKKQAKYDKTLQSNELLLVLIKSRNIETDALQMPFLQAFKEFELKETKGGVHPNDLADQRIGYWLFLYAVIQSLPMLVVDAPGLQWTEGVEYFLCEPPMGNAPWTDDAGEVRKVWVQTAGQGLVELSADVIMFSVEGIYMRSHCWLAAKQWAESGGRAPPPPVESGASPLEPPRAVFQDMDPRRSSVGNISPIGSAPGSPHLTPRNSSPAARAGHAWRSSLALGLEPLSLSDGGIPSVAAAGGEWGGGRVVSAGSRPTSSSGSGSGSGLPMPQHVASRSRSFGNLQVQQQLQLQTAAAASGGGEPQLQRNPPTGSSHTSSASVSAGGGSTFDDILKGIEKDKKPKKKSFF